MVMKAIVISLHRVFVKQQVVAFDILAKKVSITLGLNGLRN